MSIGVKAPSCYGVLFVCTGNIFRSLTAEYALKAALRGRQDIRVSSAGTADFPYVIRPYVREYLRSKGFDVSQHRRRTLTEAMLRESHLVIPMSTIHLRFLEERFRCCGPLFLEACGEAAGDLPDIEDVIPDYQMNPAAVEAHVRATIDRILSLAPCLAARLDELLQNRDQRPHSSASLHP